MNSSPSHHFQLSLRVHWEDTDAGGVVFFANYLKFFDRARTEWLRSLGFAPEALRLEHRCFLVVTDTQAQYHAPARLDDLLDVTVCLQERRPARLAIAQTALRHGLVLTSGLTRMACVDASSFRPRPIPSTLMDALQ